MTKKNELILVLGATGQQGGATATALLADGWRSGRWSAPRTATRRSRSQLRASRWCAVTSATPLSLAAALRGAYGVFSVQPSSGQPEYGVSDDDEARFGIAVVEPPSAPA